MIYTLRLFDGRNLVKHQLLDDLTYSSQGYVCFLVSGGAVKCWGAGGKGEVIYIYFLVFLYLWRRFFCVHGESTMFVLFDDTFIFSFFDSGQICDSSLGSLEMARILKEIRIKMLLELVVWKAVFSPLRRARCILV